jgi:hypothetical protein
MTKTKDIEARIELLINRTEQSVNSARSTQYSGGPVMESVEWTSVRTASLSFLAKTFGTDHNYYTEFNSDVKANWKSDGETALGILKAAGDEIKGGWLETTKGLLSAEVFSDFLEMAEHLLEEQYKDPAAVMIGSVLEEHLRQLCASAKVEITYPDTKGQTRPKKADQLNADLARVGKYNAIDQKQITAWMGIRNDAAHGNYNNYTKDQVENMLSGVQNFIARVRP